MKKNKNFPQRIEVDTVRENTTIYQDGSRSVKQLIAPASIHYTSEHEIKIENNYVRTFVISGYPANVSIGWLDAMYSYDGDMDVAVYIEPSNERTAFDELTDKITQYETEYSTEVERGSVKKTTLLASKIKALYEQRSLLEQNYESMYHVATFCAMYSDDLKTLNKEAQKFQSRLSSTRMTVMPLLLRQDDGFKTCSPYCIPEITDYYRNMNTSALSAFFPFYNSEVNHANGTLIGLNRLLNTPAIIDFFNRKVLGNANLAIIGCSGSGKTYLTSIFIMRSSLESVRHVIIDPENEYGPCTDAIGGISLKISPGSENMINPFDIDREIEFDFNGNPTGREFVDIKGKAAELLNLFQVMLPNMIDAESKADISSLIIQMYNDFGITSSPSSLYEDKSFLDEETGKYYSDTVYKIMPRFSDFILLLSQKAEKESNNKLLSIAKAFSMYCEGGIYDMFDCYTNISPELMRTATTIRFDISDIEDEVLRPVGMYVILNWTENKFIKKDRKTKKRIICDEAWMLLQKNIAGSDYTSLFLEKCARRIRKYNGSLGCISQNFREFVSRKEGENVLSSTAVKIFLKQSQEDIYAVADKFILSEGEKNFLLTATIGEALVKIGMESFIVDVFAFPFEDQLISRKYLKETER